MKIVTTTRRIESLEQATAALDELARDYDLVAQRYQDSAAESMSEFDAIRWITLCSQRRTLLRREFDDMCKSWQVPDKFLGIYDWKHQGERLENTKEGLIEIAA